MLFGKGVNCRSEGGAEIHLKHFKLRRSGSSGRHLLVLLHGSEVLTRT